MAKKKKKEEGEVEVKNMIRNFVHPRRLKAADKNVYEKNRRNYSCLFNNINRLISITKLHERDIRSRLAYDCQNIEHQMIAVRDLNLLTPKDFQKRRLITQEILDCLLRHHGVVYEGVIFGSSTNGLGFRNSDVDLRLRPLKEIGDNSFEPIEYDRPKAELTLKNIAYQTTRCSPVAGCFIPSRRCPIAKLMFLTGNPGDLDSYREAIHYDIGLLSTSALGSFNSVYIRFLCHLEPKFHILATVVRYWSKVHDLIQPGCLSSYALVNMLIFFCHNTSPPLLPTVDQMQDMYLKREFSGESENNIEKRGLTRQEWHCLICLDKGAYPPSNNKAPLSLLLLQFFEFYLNFSHSGKTIMIARNGHALDYGEFRKSSFFDPDFPLKSYLNIQDPFDMKHNLTSGMEEHSFRKIIERIRYSYEKLFKELLCNFKRPKEITEIPREANDSEKQIKAHRIRTELLDWGLNTIFAK